MINVCYELFINHGRLRPKILGEGVKDKEIFLFIGKFLLMRGGG